MSRFRMDIQGIEATGRAFESPAARSTNTTWNPKGSTPDASTSTLPRSCARFKQIDRVGRFSSTCWPEEQSGPPTFNHQLSTTGTVATFLRGSFSGRRTVSAGNTSGRGATWYRPWATLRRMDSWRGPLSWVTGRLIRRGKAVIQISFPGFILEGLSFLEVPSRLGLFLRRGQPVELA